MSQYPIDAPGPTISFEMRFTDMMSDVHHCARAKGWWSVSDKPLEVNFSKAAEKIALMHSELSEALEALRHGNPPDDKIPEFTGLEAELADVVIRVMDFAAAYNLRLAKAIVAKHEFNTTREWRHGGKVL